MNYIKKLEKENKAMKRALERTNTQIKLFTTHIFSDKFHCGNELDGYISTNDVDNHLTLIRNALYHE
ncbi:MAG: hypothetical protein V3V00_10430 [Saprospiraceae bacterium]